MQDQPLVEVGAQIVVAGQPSPVGRPVAVEQGLSLGPGTGFGNGFKGQLYGLTPGAGAPGGDSGSGRWIGRDQ